MMIDNLRTFIFSLVGTGFSLRDRKLTWIFIDRRTFNVMGTLSGGDYS